jgi:hypothetical protein
MNGRHPDAIAAIAENASVEGEFLGYGRLMLKL